MQREYMSKTQSYTSFVAWRVGVGSNRRSLHQVLNSNRAVAHPNYSEANNMRLNDIGIIFLQQAIALTPNIFPIHLPPLNAKNQLLLNIQGMVLGFAGSQTSGTEGLENLQGAHVRIMNHAECQQHYPLSDVTQHFCAVDTELRSNFCLGDQVIYYCLQN
jgi:hypothetical protein